MVEIVVAGFERWQEAARDLLRRGVSPEEVHWVEGEPSHQVQLERTAMEGRGAFLVPRRFIELARAAAAHQSPGRWDAIYRVLWRLVHENRRLLDVEEDPDVRALAALQPSYQTSLSFNSEPSLPGIGELTRKRASTVVPPAHDLSALSAAAATCTGCELYKTATQVVFGRGPATAQLALVGEQPGDQEDLQGAPFVGPAGEVLDRALLEIGLDRQRVYVTNVVKHFKWEPRGKRRIHQTPRAHEIEACRPWLEAELGFVKPRVIVCLGSTAAQALIGPQFRITKSRGQFFRSRWAPWVVGTYHPSAVLRAEDPAGAEAVYRWLVDDLRQAAARAEQVGSAC